MSLTVTNRYVTNLGNKKSVVMDLAFDSSYPFGGESLTKESIGLRALDHFLVNPASGLTFEFDHSNEKLKAFRPAPPIVYGEAHSIASNAITLEYPAAAIMNIASGTQSQMLIEPADTLAANECKLTAAMAEGERTGITFHSSTAGVVYVSYITQAWREVWENRNASTAFTTASHVAAIGEVVCFVESCFADGDTASSRPKWVRGGDAAGTGECEIDFTDAGASDLTTLTFAAGDVITGGTITYIALPSSGMIYNNFIEDEDCTMSSGTGNAAYPVLFTSLCGQFPDYTAANERAPHTLMMPEADALGTSAECAIDWHKVTNKAGQQIRLNDATSDAISLTYVMGFAGEIQNLSPLEVKNGTDLSAVTNVRVMAIGD